MQEHYMSSGSEGRHGVSGTESGLTLEEKLSQLPTEPGVYQYKDSSGKVIYVGKAKNLRARVRSYFQEGRPRDAKTTALVRKIDDLEIIVTDSAVEALILEDTLIKDLRPRYNIMLRDDKTYPRIRVTNEPFPRVFPTRRIVRDGSRYFGPYTDGKYVRYLMRTLRSIFPIRSCDLGLTDESISQGKYKVCLDFQIGRCDGPCEAHVTRAEYGAMIDGVVQVLKGRTKRLEVELEREMEIYAEKMMFEKAARSRDRLKKLKEYNARQKVVTEDLADRDIVGVYREDDDAGVVILRVREGRLIGKRHHYLGGVLHAEDTEVLRNLLRTHYMAEEPPPDEVLVGIDPGEEFDELELFLSSIRKDGTTRLVVPKIGDKIKLVAMATSNAKLLIGELKLQRMKRSEGLPRVLESLQRDLRLDKPPRRIECFDNSNFHGTDPVASMVCFIDAKPRKSEYRKFKIKTVDGPDDFASMKEVVTRRYRRLLSEGGALPDLVLIDGGKGQVSSATAAMDELGLGHIPLVGIAKRLEEIVVPYENETILLPKSSSSLRLLQQLRDEAHRFAITFHRSLRDKRTVKSELTNIPGVGPSVAKKIINSYGSVRSVVSATRDDLMATLGMKTGERVYAYFHGDPADHDTADEPETSEE